MNTEIINYITLNYIEHYEFLRQLKQINNPLYSIYSFMSNIPNSGLGSHIYRKDNNIVCINRSLFRIYNDFDLYNKYSKITEISTDEYNEIQRKVYMSIIEKHYRYISISHDISYIDILNIVKLLISKQTIEKIFDDTECEIVYNTLKLKFKNNI